MSIHFLDGAWNLHLLRIQKKQFRNRGFITGPFCFIYGFTGFLLTFFFQELRMYPGYLFLQCTIVATAVEWLPERHWKN